MTRIRSISARHVLTRQRSGFLTSRPYPFTHTLSPYVGCELGSGYCGTFCYAAHMPNWRFADTEEAWGHEVLTKDDAGAFLAAELARKSADRRREMRVFMSPSTDPYQPVEKRTRLTRDCLATFTRFPELDLLVMQTRSPLARRDLDLMQDIDYMWLSVTIETDDEGLIRRLGGGPAVRSRLYLVEQAIEAGIDTQIAVSPCLPHTRDFARLLASAGAGRIVIDTFVAGDGSGGKRTAQSTISNLLPDWSSDRQAARLYRELAEHGVDVAWSAAGFCGIPYRMVRDRAHQQSQKKHDPDFREGNY